MTVITQVKQYFAHKYDTTAFKNNWSKQYVEKVPTSVQDSFVSGSH